MNNQTEKTMKIPERLDIFFTTSILSASMYAKKACKKYGGNPIIYIVKPIGQYFNTVNTEYIADKALIINKAEGV